MEDLVWLERALSASVKRRGEVPLTNAHLLNIVRMARRMEAAHQQNMEDMLNEAMAADKQWGDS